MENENSGSKPNLVPALLLALFLVAGGYYLYSNKITVNNTLVADKKDVVDAMANVATVNGVPITADLFNNQLNLTVSSYKSQGIDVADEQIVSQIKTEVLDGLIANELLIQGAMTDGAKANPEDVEKQFQSIVTNSGGLEALQANLQKNNLTEAMLKEDIAKQLAVQAYIMKNVDLVSITVSEKEISDFYDAYLKTQKDEVPPLRELSAEIKQQITMNKQQSRVIDFIKVLRGKADVEVVKI